MSGTDIRSERFREESGRALGDVALRGALKNIQDHLVTGRAKAFAEIPEFQALRDAGAAIKDHVLAHLDLYLELFADKVAESGGRVHWAADATEARQIVGDLCREAGARLVVKGKSMVSEEVGLNDCLEKAGIEVRETDLGEYAIQLRGEPPSHIIAPAVHLNRSQFAEAFRAHHRDLPKERDLSEPALLLAEARATMRETFGQAEVGITGANFLVAESGSAVLVTNEGNADLCMTLPRTHIVLTGIEKLVPTFDDALVLLRLLARSATGQPASAYTSIVTGPRRADDPEGPTAFHVVLVDNGRTRLLGSRQREMLRCIRCGACLNHCPVYGAVGGHAYGWVYPGPMGSVLTPSFVGLDRAGDLPNASTVCGRCDEVCPVRIPLTRLMRNLREDQFRRREVGRVPRLALALWGALAMRPPLYRWATRLAIRVLAIAGGRSRRLRRLPLLGAWTDTKDFPAPSGRSFVEQWRSGRR